MKLDILLLCNKPLVGQDANTIVDHIEAFEKYSEHTIWVYSNLGDFSKKLDLSKFDVIMIHYSLFILSSRYLTHSAKKKLREYTGMKVIFIQDEYRKINHMVDELAYLGIDVLFTCFPESEFEKIYPATKLPKLSKYNNLTGYVPQRLTECNNQPLIRERPIHVGYRGRQLPYWYGALGYEKYDIVTKWRQNVPKDVLKTDISCLEIDRIYGENWKQFLSACKATLGVESGTSVMDFTGALERQVDAHQLAHPEDTFESVQKKYFLDQEGLYKLNQISPRCFEAIALKTVLVLYVGEYSGILTPGRHYIALEKDYSNISDVLAYLQNDAFLQNMADTAYEEIALNPQYSYQAFIKRVDKIIQDEFIERKLCKTTLSYDTLIFQKHIRSRTLKNALLFRASSMYKHLPFRTRLTIKNYVVKACHFFKVFFRKNDIKINGTLT